MSSSLPSSNSLQEEKAAIPNNLITRVCWALEMFSGNDTLKDVKKSILFFFVTFLILKILRIKGV